MLKPPKPMSRANVLRTLESYEKSSDEVLSISKEFKLHCEDVWDLKAMTQKELIALQESLTKKAGRDYLLVVHLSR